MTWVDSTVSVGRWVNRELVDGVIVRPGGARQTVGNGAVYSPPTVASVK